MLVYHNIYISNAEHYTNVFANCKNVKHSLWIGTADIKDAYIEDNGEKMPFLKLMAQLIRKGGGDTFDTCKGTRTGIQRGF